MRKTGMGGLVVATFAPCTPIDLMMADLAAAFNGWGVPTRAVLHGPGSDTALLVQVIRDLNASGQFGFVVAMNGKFHVTMADAEGRLCNIHDALRMPLVAFLVDHPAQHGEHLRALPRHAVVTVIDERHRLFLEQAGIEPERIIFCPHGGPAPIPDLLPAGDREIDLLFVGNLGDVPATAEWLERTAAEPARRTVLARVLDAALAGEEVYGAVVREFAAAGFAHDPWDVAPVVVAVDAYVTQSRRLDVLRAIRSRRVVVVGALAPSVAARLSHHDLRGEVQFPVVLRLMAESKVLINSRRTFAGGAHERVFYGLSRGAVALTEPSTFLADELDRRAGMVALPDGAADLDRLADELCGDVAGLAAIAERGLSEYAQRHSWQERAGRMLAGLGQFAAG